MKSLPILAIGAALLAGSSALASAQPHDGDHDRRVEDRHFQGDRDRHEDRDDRRFYGDRDGRFERERYFVGQRQFIQGYYWTWDGGRWYRRDNRGINLYFNF